MRTWAFKLGRCCLIAIASWGVVVDLNTIGLAQELSPRSTTTKPMPTMDGENLIRLLEEKVKGAVERSRGGVVAIACIERQPEPRQQALQFQFGIPQAFGKFAVPTSPDFQPQAYGTGLVWDEKGTIVTPYHVLGDPRLNDYYVWGDGRPFPAKLESIRGEVQAGDPYSDLAVLKVDPAGFTPMEKLTDAPIAKGQFIVHLSNPESIAKDGRMSAGWGLVSNLQRAPINMQGASERETLAHFGTLIQLDARLPLGCSGGALLNLDGQLIGMTISNAGLNQGESSLGFAIPLDETFVRVVEQLKEGKLPAFGFLGIQPEDLSPEERRQGRSGVRVVAVVRGMPGDLAGVREDDWLLEVDGRLVDSRSALFRELSRKGADQEVKLKVMRTESNRSKELELNAKLSKKYVATHRPSFALYQEPQWRGMQVEYATALPPEMIRFPVRGGAAGTSLATLNVEPDSPAWNAGIRSGTTIVSVAGAAVSSPSDFAGKVAEYDGRPVRIKVVSHGDKIQEVEVAPN